MALFLVQHGKSLPKDQDPDQGLSEEGFSDTERIARVAKDYQVSIACIQHSGKKRALQTARIFASVLNLPRGVQERSGLKPLDDVIPLADTLESEQNLMLVGHLPFMQRLTSYLITGSIDIPVFKFQNSGIVCLEKHRDIGSWMIRWTLTPDIG